MSGYTTPPERGTGPREARRAAARLPVLWVVLPLAIVVVVAIAFALRAVL